MKQECMLAVTGVLVVAMAVLPGMADAHHYFGDMSVTYYERTSYDDVDLIQIGMVVEVKDTGWACDSRYGCSGYGGSWDTTYFGGVYLNSPDGPDHTSHVQRNTEYFKKEYPALEDLDANCSGAFKWFENKVYPLTLCYVVPRDFEVDALGFGKFAESDHNQGAVVPLRDPSTVCDRVNPTYVGSCDEEARYIVGAERARVLTSIYFDGTLVLTWDRTVNLYNTGNVGLITDLDAYTNGGAPLYLPNAEVYTVDGKQLSEITVLRLDSFTAGLVNESLAEQGDMYFTIETGAAHTAKLNDVTGDGDPILVTDTLIVE